ncbi:hypothetical protein HK097_003289 [Rhizophlyctis rosea]|uniref:PRELI/MSF1 domain-containing protein n=1 Tax=Rhizophlyctis rosea TaxID=64517 RepID=A0AAD5SFY7_9FUNG|nr:hypothetical protein HK097_003289 [Rhizophlyctis rosea]
MKLYNNSSTFPHPWSTITTANFQKYPNPISTHVLSVDILSRHIDPKTGFLHTERLLVCRQPAPALLRRLLPIPDEAIFREISIVDPKTQTYTATSWNLTMRSIIEVEETCVFRPHPDNRWNETVFEQTAKFTAGGWSNLAKMVEDNAVNAFQNNAGKGRKGLELVIDQVIREAKEVEERLTQGLKEVEEGITKSFEEVEERFTQGLKEVEEGIKQGLAGAGVAAEGNPSSGWKS